VLITEASTDPLQERAAQGMLLAWRAHEQPDATAVIGPSGSLTFAGCQQDVALNGMKCTFVATYDGKRFTVGTGPTTLPALLTGTSTGSTP